MLSDRELATVLAALRHWRNTQSHQSLADLVLTWPQFTTHDPLLPAEVDALCERLNDACGCVTPGPFCCGIPGVLARIVEGRIDPASVECCDECARLASDDDARQYLVELGFLNGTWRSSQPDQRTSLPSRSDLERQPPQGGQEELRLLTQRDLALIRAALQYFDEEMSPHGVDGMRSYLDESCQEDIQVEDVATLREFLRDCELKYVVYDMTATQMIHAEFFDDPANAQQFAQAHAGTVATVLLTVHL